MCQYFGGKIRIGKEISNFLLDHELSVLGNNDNKYFEPFLGMAGVFRHIVKQSDRECIGCDKHEDLSIMWKSIKNGWEPPRTISREIHMELKKGEPSALRGFVGFGCSFMGRFFSGFTETCFKSYKQIMSVSSLFQSTRVIFLNSSDYTIHDPHGMTIYCDPPYMESNISNDEVKGFRCFDHSMFWETMRRWSIDNLVYISETSSPDDFTCIWEKRVGRNFYKKGNTETNKSGRIEKIFCHNSYVVIP